MSLQLLGDMPVKQFLARYWQKRPLVVRQAIPGFKGVVQIPELLRLASHRDVESRLVVRRGRRWELHHGPFRPTDIASMPAKNWTVLVQSLNLHHDDADRLLQRFSFIPRTRLDDLMVSYAAPGGGVGPHVDSYDVFLLQGQGRRRWRIGTSGDGRLRPGLPLAILARFEHRREWTLHPGDMLYLPPGHAHDGVALEPCTTYSIGFRAPTARQLASALLSRIEESLEDRFADRRYRDTGSTPARKPALVPASLVDFGKQVARSLRLRPSDIEACIGEYISEPKTNLDFEPPSPPLSLWAFERSLKAGGLVLDRRTRLLYRNGRLFINGELFAIAARDRRLLESLADARALPAGSLVSRELRKLFHGWYVEGWLHPGKVHGR